MDRKLLTLMALIALTILLSVQALHGSSSGQLKESSFDRVQKTRTLRCAYAPLSPFINVDPASGKISGVSYDVAEEIGRRLDLKIEWTEEVGYGQLAAGFAAGRYDAFCGVLWATPARAGAMNFSAPLYYNKINPCVRADTTEYDRSVEALNSPDKTLIAYDGDVSMQVARSVFPKAKILSLQENTPFGEAMQNVIGGKADALATCDQTTVDDLNKASKKKVLKLAAPGHPITHVKVVLGIPIQDEALKSMMDVAIFDLQADDSLKKIMTHYLGAERVGDTKIIPDPVK